jgi:hypothetical protein
MGGLRLRAQRPPHGRLPQKSSFEAERQVSVQAYGSTTQDPAANGVESDGLGDLRHPEVASSQWKGPAVGRPGGAFSQSQAAGLSHSELTDVGSGSCRFQEQELELRCGPPHLEPDDQVRHGLVIPRVELGQRGFVALEQ